MINRLKQLLNKQKKILVLALIFCLLMPTTVLGAPDFWGDFKSGLLDYVVKPAIGIAIFAVIEFGYAMYQNNPDGKATAIRHLGAAAFVAGIGGTAIWKWL